MGDDAMIQADRRSIDGPRRPAGAAPGHHLASYLDDAEHERMVDALGLALRLADGLGAGLLRELVEWMADHFGIDPSGLPSVADDLATAGLTTRERDVLRRIVAGRSNKEIGVDLGISEKTAEAHVSSVLRKLGVTNRVEAATRGIVLGFGDEAASARPMWTGTVA